MLSLLLFLSAMLSCTACSSTSPIADEPGLDATRIEMPTAHPPEGMRLSAVPTWTTNVRAAFAYSGGAFGDERVFVMGAILVEHPRGNLLFDAGFGHRAEEHAKTSPWQLRLLARYDKGPTVADQLRDAGIRQDSLLAVVLTHAHWDHVSGIEDLLGVPVWVSWDEMWWIASGNPMATLARRLGAGRFQPYGFERRPYLGFAVSHDVFGDGSVVLVPAPGHTPGSIIAFISLPSGKRYALIGDLAWQKEGIAIPAEKPWLARHWADDDPAAVRELLWRMHELARDSNLTIVPAHDLRVWKQLPTLTTRH